MLSTSSPPISSSSILTISWRHTCSAWATDHVALTLAGLVTWITVYVALVFSPGFYMDLIHLVMDLAGLPGVRLMLTLVGIAALCVIAAMLSRLPAMNWLR
ncbi:MAG: hypothetical protein MO846_02835 [Candidatus Devosia symbiotica]|nr:hypothetical protein [Candidatus Devosia symbiotica]